MKDFFGFQIDFKKYGVGIKQPLLSELLEGKSRNGKSN